MKIGIMTFHWATNYGAVLQAYALQEYLESMGHSVEIINYKPRQYDFSWLKNLQHPRNLIHLDKIIKTRRKEKLLSVFRMKYLQMSDRYYSITELKEKANGYDVLISGSDQILNPSFTTTGENGPTSAYYLDFGDNAKKIGYAVSFGCVKYPEKALPFAKKWINDFSTIGVREDSGVDLLESMNFTGQCEVVPDPTVLLGKELFKRLNVSKNHCSDRYCLYILRKKYRVDLNDIDVVDDTSNILSMEGWIDIIINSKGLITNSYHGMIVALLNHVPFVVILETNRSAGMNDRFYTLLKRVKLENRICNEGDDYSKIICEDVDWISVDKLLEKFRIEANKVINV